ncbi:hypothetical protein ACLOJK_007449 [Asimina triloba]
MEEMGRLAVAIWIRRSDGNGHDEVRQSLSWRKLAGSQPGMGKMEVPLLAAGGMTDVGERRRDGSAARRRHRCADHRWRKADLAEEDDGGWCRQICHRRLARDVAVELGLL